jgi:SOS-response transcriptional repressor LexA
MPGKSASPKFSRRPLWADAIRELRSRLGLNQEEFGARIGFSAMAVSRWERGALEPPSHGYIRLGNLARDASCWRFWERAGLRSEDVMRVVPTVQPSTQVSEFHSLEIVNAGPGRKKLKDKVQLVAIPLLKVVAAGHGEKGDDLPVLNDAPMETMIAAPTAWCPNPSHTTCLRVRGDSMAPLIHDGFVVAVDSSETDPSKLDAKWSSPGIKTLG